ncbi:MAG: tyrosine--tRNA ligase [Chlamydiia bacterium]
MFDVLQVLRERDLLEASSDEELSKVIQTPVAVYCGIDPTADSMHLGHLLFVVVLRWWQLAGHRPVIIVGGATGRVGDPGGKSVERPVLGLDVIRHNVACLEAQLKRLMPAQGALVPVVITNNADWFEPMGVLDFLRDVGKYFRIGQMIAKESVRTRLQSEEGISYTEFSYQILQAYDFLYLLRHFDVQVQIGGSDQWGNITAGIDLVRRLEAKEVYGVTFPLLLRSDGKKFGKSEDGAVWLDTDKVSPYQFYQYLLRVPDADVVLMLKRLTFLPLPEVEAISLAMGRSDYVPFSAQKVLAEEITRFVHGEAGLVQAQLVTSQAAPGGETQLDEATLEVLAENLGVLRREEKELVGCKVGALLVDLKLASSKGEARRLILNGGVSLNNQKVEDAESILKLEDFVAGRFALFAVGKRKKAVVERI